MGNTHVKLFLISTSSSDGDVILSFFLEKDFSDSGHFVPRSCSSLCNFGRGKHSC